MVIHILIGALAMWVILFLVDFTKQKDLAVPWWQWLLTALNVIYFLFVLELFYGFLGEGASQAAFIMGMFTALLGVIWAVLLGRFVFAKPFSNAHPPGPTVEPSPATK